MSDPQIRTPGDSGPTDPTALESMLKATIPDIAAGLDDLSDDDLATLQALEMAGAGRKGVTDAIAMEQKRRAREADEAQASTDDAEQSAYGPDAATSYRHLTARQIDASKLTQPVLSRDGWVMPNPAAKAEG
ncbi:hypothetical protein [Xanthomonas rydalmerensis]|uniref:Uncharacterized protein n=1 Tax=Xanthomonas rydalmerensis TaxID=3046274 RepID=A0ABZ0JMT1_9XANT|nr:hypothetical protein [Xanthomonas sp. DM-2023]WOS40693.1 hypothetical protein QN243_20245 [Xanthomonas sp. DM-2023]WOS44877.1 hypothetical protein QN242_20245 [Xanthomonas sp. DM-2023]WOS49057.1 hypothetical protein QN240_20245 [Xanthomonas sp. DM-2023]WOS53237.1 hypothetical protein QN244_20250 [Xanthomonas sp. DM-2023]WOS57420.1 hypothetical protein QN245_20245 [Xanthomonas sp. DM-2023]